jgi:hypothetical protein
MPSAGEKAIFAYFFWRLQKSMASGGTRPAGFSALEHHQKQTNGVWLPSCQVEVLKRRKEVQGCKLEFMDRIEGKSSGYGSKESHQP